MSKIFITGGAGYVGSRLVPQLIEEGHEVIVYDTFYFGDEFFTNIKDNLKLIKGDIRDTKKLKESIQNSEVFLNLACISNDASFELDENLSTSVNLHAFEPMVVAAKEAGIKRFIYASTSSVYGVSKEKNVREDHKLVPLTLYNKYKGMCEPILIKHTDSKFNSVIFRPATVCGYAPRQRFDLSVNILTNLAINKEEITVFGGDQLRPNLHIQDYCDVVKLFIKTDLKKINGEIFNVGYQNMSIKEISFLVKKVVEEEFIEKKGKIKILFQKSDDLRSYHINSEKIEKILNFKPKRSIEYAIRELCDKFKNNKFKDSTTNDLYFNVKRLKKLQIK